MVVVIITKTVEETTKTKIEVEVVITKTVVEVETTKIEEEAAFKKKLLTNKISKRKLRKHLLA